MASVTSVAPSAAAKPLAPQHDARPAAACG